MQKLNLGLVYKISDNVISKTIENELVIITMNDGISDVDSSIYTLNQTGKAVWDKLDGKSSLKKIINQLASEYKVPEKKIEKDIKELMLDMIEKKLVFEN